MGLGRGVRWLRCSSLVAGAVCAAAVLSATPGPVSASGPETPASDRSRSSRRLVPRPAPTQWEQAERLREDLEAIPAPERTRVLYTRTMDAYRAIYHEHPGDLHAAAAVYSVAELLAEQGRGLHDPKSLKAAIAQYEFLRAQYPGSSLRVQALLDEGQIAQNDLSDPAAARAAYQALTRDYPRSAQAEEARAALGSLDQPAATAGATLPAPPHRGTNGVEPAPNTATVQAATIQAATIQAPAASPPYRPADGAAAAPAAPTLAELDLETRPQSADASTPKRIGKRAVVTGIRHWSTATYTRVAIDLGDSVTYEAARVPSPDRIYFDLHGTRLAQELVGKSFSVTDDGFLKKIRAAQFSDDMTRIVLDVNDVTEYSAFLLPNPYRLIIDIHGKQGAAPGPLAAANPSAARPALTSQPTVSSVAVPPPHAAGLVQSTTAKPVPNTLTSRQTSSAEVAAVSDVPGKVEATTRPTSQPISAVVNPAAAPSIPTPPPGAGSPTEGVAIAQAPDSASFPGSVSKKPRRNAKTAVAGSAASPARAASPTADGETSLVRALGLKIGRIVIDAGHGGHDSGTLGVDGLEEKDVVLDVALRVGKLLHERLGAEIIYTRSDDTFIPLETRTAIANKAQADLFLSIHANSSSEPSARGVETYYLNFTSDPSAIETAARENAVSDQSIHQLSDLVKKIALKDKIAESREFASDVESSLYTGLARGNDGLKNRGVKKAPFVVLIGANMPSILAEISFVTNPRDAEELRNPEYRQRVAESLYRGVARYEGGLSGSRIPVERAAVGQ